MGVSLLPKFWSETMWLRNMVLAGLGFGLMAVPTAIGQSAPSDMLIPPALYAVVGAPFTATVEWNSTETKADGTTVNHRRVSRIMRDSAGRQRFEDGQDEAGPQAAEPPTIRLYNPVTHLFANLDSATGVAKISTMGATSALPSRVPSSSNTTGPVKGQADLQQSESRADASVTREPLPPREIAGLQAEGVRTTTTIPSEKDGGPAVRVVDDVWESPLWRMELLHIHDDPRTGRSQAQVTELTREEPDEALFSPPGGYTKDNWEIEGHFSVVLPKPSPLPRPIVDDNLADAADRVIAAATAHSDNLFAPYHERYELTMTDYKGEKHQGSIETWISPAGFRFELHTDTYNEVRVSNYATGQMWGMRDGILPLRVVEFVWDRVLPRDAVQRVLHGGGTIPGLKTVTVADEQLTCAGIGATAQMCFDPLTGFIVSGSLESERVEYEGWKKVDTWKYRVSTLRIYQDKNLLVEARLTAAGMEFSPDIFQQIDGLREMQTNSKDRNSSPTPNPQQHRILARGVSAQAARIHGYAQTHVWVDTQGIVTRAEVEDADDAQVAAAALESARKTVYQPWLDNGQPSAFETTILSTYLAAMPARAR